MFRNPILYLCCFCLFYSVFVHESFSQDMGYMTIKGTVILKAKTLEGVKVVLYKKGSKYAEDVTKANGKFNFTELTLTVADDEYIIELSKPGHVTLKQFVSTHVPPDYGIQYPTYVPTIELFESVPNLDKELTLILDKPISRFAYNPERRDFYDDKAYFRTVQSKVEQLFSILRAEADDRYKLIAEYRKKKMDEEKKKAQEDKLRREAEEKYKNILAKGDKLFNDKDFFNAKAFYLQAHNILPDEQYATGKIDEIDRMLTAKVEEEEKKKTDLLKAELEKKAKEEVAKATEQIENKAVKAEEEKKLVEESELEKELLAKQKQELAEKQRKEAELLAAQEQLKRENEAKAAEQLQAVKIRQAQIKTEVNKQVISSDFRDLLMIANSAERETKIEKTKAVSPTSAAKTAKLPSTTRFAKYEYMPRIVKSEESTMMTTTKKAIIHYPTKSDTLKAVKYLWGETNYYKNSTEIDETQYRKELNKFSFIR